MWDENDVNSFIRIMGKIIIVIRVCDRCLRLDNENENMNRKLTRQLQKACAAKYQKAEC